MITQWNNEQLQSEYTRLVQAGWDRSLDIAKRRKERHEKIDFDNPNFTRIIQELEQEMKNRGFENELCRKGCKGSLQRRARSKSKCIAANIIFKVVAKLACQN
jgi:hypothetical protein